MNINSHDKVDEFLRKNIQGLFFRKQNFNRETKIYDSGNSEGKINFIRPDILREIKQKLKSKISNLI